MRNIIATLLLSALVACTVSVVAAQEKKTNGKQTKTEKKRPVKRSDGVRTLEDINIEGEIAVPQVLFIPARDYRRFRDGLDKKYRKSTLEVAQSINLPIRLRFVEPHKEEK